VPDNPGVQLALGILYFRRNEPAQAIRHLERAVKLGTTENKTWLYLGQSYMRAGREAEGKRTLAQFQRGARMSRTVSQLENRLLNIPGDTPAQVREKNELRLRLVRVYMEDTNYPRAVGHLRILLESDPGNIEGQKLLRECQTRSEALAAKAAAAPRQGAPPNAPGPMGPR
jgi:predicted Zn-dependent protease